MRVEVWWKSSGEHKLAWLLTCWNLLKTWLPCAYCGTALSGVGASS
jgi:hypothetical protein